MRSFPLSCMSAWFLCLVLVFRTFLSLCFSQRICLQKFIDVCLTEQPFESISGRLYWTGGLLTADRSIRALEIATYLLNQKQTDVQRLACSAIDVIVCTTTLLCACVFCVLCSFAHDLFLYFHVCWFDQLISPYWSHRNFLSKFAERCFSYLHVSFVVWLLQNLCLPNSLMKMKYFKTFHGLNEIYGKIC